MGQESAEIWTAPAALQPGRLLSPTLLACCLAAACAPKSEPGWTGAERFERYDAAGTSLPADSDVAHHCVRDRATGLVWLVWPPGRAGATYTWYSEDRAVNLSEPGLAGGGECGLSRCDTEALVAAVNAEGWCGANDWRLPRRDEALTLTARAPADHPHVLDPDAFPDAVAGEYWTVETYRLYPKSAWAFDARTGLDRGDWKTAAKPVRLVRGEFDPGKRPKL